MRRSLLLKLLALALGVASLAVIATALWATYGTGSALRDEVDGSTSLLETDSRIRDSLLAYAQNNDTWDGVEAHVRDLAEDTGRRIALTDQDGQLIADSADLLDQGGADLPSTRAATIDATDSYGRPGTSRLLLGQPPPQASGALYFSWQATDQEERQRQDLADEAVSCLRDKGVEATITANADQGPGVFVVMNGKALDTRNQFPTAVDDCIPDELDTPTKTARAINAEAIDLATACLAEHRLPYQVATDSHGMRIVEPKGDAEVATSAKWTTCTEDAQAEALQPYVASPAELYLGTTDRFNPFSSKGWWRTASTVGAVLVAVAVITVLAGRRLAGPIRGLTAAAQRMTDGDRTARVPVRGSDEVGRLSAAFNEMADSIETTETQRRALIGDVAHELRTPLANVRTHLEAVDVGLAPLDESLVQSLREESELLERLVSDLQELALADAGMLRLHREECDAAAVAGLVVAAHQAHAGRADVQLKADLPGRLPVVADPERLRQALGNLVSNAIAYTPKDGSVTVASRRVGGEAVLTVTDTGEGISAVHLPHVFDRFFRVDTSRSRDTGGSGLGLAITKYLIDAHGWRIDVESVPGHGSTFTIHLIVG